MTEQPWREAHAEVNGVRLHFVEAGSGPLVLLLHGFPEFWYSWRHQIPALASAGFHVVAPDLRGYNLSDKPPRIADYRMSVLVEDVAGLIRQVGGSRAAVVGHDWGGGIGWQLAMTRPELVERLAVLNAPHPAAFRREMTEPGQIFRSAYMFFFQLPWLPEWVLRSGDFAFLDAALRRPPARRGAFTAEDVRRYRAALAVPGALTAALNYYRANMRYARELPEPREITVPTLLVWGERDRYLGVRLTEGLGRWVKDLRVERLPRASHWVQNDEPEAVNRLLVGFLGGSAC